MKERVLLDINVLIDVLARREPYYAASAAVWAGAESRGIEGFVSANSITTAYYLLRKVSDRATAKQGIHLTKQVFHIASIDEALIEKALNSSFDDFENAVQHETALRVKATAIITRNVRDFRYSSVSVFTPDAFLDRIAGRA